MNMDTQYHFQYHGEKFYILLRVQHLSFSLKVKYKKACVLCVKNNVTYCKSFYCRSQANVGTIALHVCKKTQLVPVYPYREKLGLQQK